MVHAWEDLVMWPCYYYIVALVGGYDIVEVYGNNSVSEYAAYHVVWVCFYGYIAYRVFAVPHELYRFFEAEDVSV